MNDKCLKKESHPNERVRIDEREKQMINFHAINSDMLKKPEIRTRDNLFQKRRIQQNSENQAKFGNNSQGIHGKELPKFFEGEKQYYKKDIPTKNTS